MSRLKAGASFFRELAAYVSSVAQTGPAAVLHELAKAGNKYEPPPRLIPPATRSGFTESFDGTQIYWELHGPELAKSKRQPRPMVFCYGLVCSMNQWRMQLERYSPDRSCVLLDYRGHHHSAFPSDPNRMNLAALAKDVAAVMNHLEITEACHIWGHSLGVDVALELAAAEPDRCRSLVLCAGTVQNPFKFMFGMGQLEAIMSPLLTIYPSKAEVFNLVWRFVQTRPELTLLGSRLLGFNMDASSLKDVETYTKSVVSTDPRTFFLLLRELSKGMTQALLAKIHVPALVVAGSKDPVTPPEQMRAFVERLSRGKFVEIPAGSHNVQLDFGEYVCLKAEEFWREQHLE